MWCCNTFWEKWVTLPSYSWRAKMLYWWTVSLCHVEATHVTTAGLCVSLFSYQRRIFLVLLGYCMLVDLFYQLFMKKCERQFWLKLKKHSEKATFRLRGWLLSPCCCLHIYAYRYHCLLCCLYQTSRSHLNLTLIKAPS